MSPTVIVLVLLSATLHPLWNALAKSDLAPDAAFLNLLAVGSACALVHSLIAGVSPLSVVDAWPLMLVSATGLSIYLIGLSITLRRGDLSIYYPIIRSSPVFVVAASYLLLGERYDAVVLAGIAIVTAGMLLIQYRRGSRLFDDPLTLLAALCALAGTGIYSLADVRAAQLLEPMVIFFWQTFGGLLVLCVYHLVVRSPGLGTTLTAIGVGWRARPGRFLIAGMLVYASYGLILESYARGGDVAAVTTVRQASIPISVLVGVFALGEGQLAWRLGWSLAIGVGITIVALNR